MSDWAKLQTLPDAKSNNTFCGQTEIQKLLPFVSAMREYRCCINSDKDVCTNRSISFSVEKISNIELFISFVTHLENENKDPSTMEQTRETVKAPKLTVNSYARVTCQSRFKFPQRCQC